MRHDPILVPAATLDVGWQTLWRWWCNCGNGGNPHTYEDASKQALQHVAAKDKK